MSWTDLKKGDIMEPMPDLDTEEALPRKEIVTTGKKARKGSADVVSWVLPFPMKTVKVIPPPLVMAVTLTARRKMLTVVTAVIFAIRVMIAVKHREGIVDLAV